jgi:hypothetical protein
MNAMSIIQTLTFAKASADKLETATQVLTSLKEMQRVKGMPFFAIRRAIKIQKKIVRNCNPDN